MSISSYSRNQVLKKVVKGKDNEANNFSLRDMKFTERSPNKFKLALRIYSVLQKFYWRITSNPMTLNSLPCQGRLNRIRSGWRLALAEERGDVPGWVLVVLMTTGLVTAIWTIAAPRLSTILRNSLDSMNSIR